MYNISINLHVKFFFMSKNSKSNKKIVSYIEAFRTICKELDELIINNNLVKSLTKKYDVECLEQLNLMFLNDCTQLKNYFSTKHSQIFFDLLIKCNLTDSISFLLKNKIYKIFDNDNLSQKIFYQPLHQACFSFKPKIIKQLIAYGFDVNLKTHSLSPMDVFMEAAWLQECIVMKVFGKIRNKNNMCKTLHLLLKNDTKFTKYHLSQADSIEDKTIFQILNNQQILKNKRALEKAVSQKQKIKKSLQHDSINSSSTDPTLVSHKNLKAFL